MVVDTRTALRTVSFEQARAAVSKVGDEIADRLEEWGDERWSDLIRSWRARDQGDPVALLAWSASLDREVARSFISEGALSAPADVTDAANDDDELRIAARMASALPAEQIRQVIELVREFALRRAPHLDDLSGRVRAYIDDNFDGRRAHEQGEAAANFVRERLQLASVQFVDIFATVENLGIALHIRNVQPSTLDGLAAWGPHHGPAVLLNENGIHVGSHRDLRRSWAARVTLAHELCHLLLDRGLAISAVDVLNSRMPLDMERRAKAFAGELLLPGRIAADIWMRSKSPRSLDGLKSFVEGLCKRYGVTRSVAAWKLEHGLHRRDIDLRSLLDAVVPQR